MIQRESVFSLMFATIIGAGESSFAAMEEQSAAIEEIVVTARKREESIQEVPIAVSSVDQELLDELTIQSGIDLVRQIPSATFVSGGPAYLADISIRGQGAGRLGFTESATGIYRDGVYSAGGGFGGRSFNRMDLFDIESIETYRGPQSGLYGRNAVGGAINIRTNKPEFEHGGRLKVGYEDTERTNVEAVANVALTEHIAGRISGIYTDQDDGFVTDAASGEDLDTEDYHGVRGALRGRFDATTDASVTVEYWESDAPSFSVLGRRLPIDNGGVPVPGEIDPGRFERNASSIGRVEIEELAVMGSIEKSFADVDAVATALYKDRDGKRSGDDLDHFLGFQGVAGTDLQVSQQEDFERFGLEARLSSAGDGNWHWLVGGEVQLSESDVVQQNEGGSGIPSLNALGTRRDSFREEIDSFSVFGTLERALTNRLTLALEGRLIRDEKQFVFVREQIGMAADIDTGDLEETETRFLPGASLTFDLGDSGNVYARFATGYRPFGFNNGVPSAEFIPYDEEIARSLEVGWKNDLLQNRVRYSLAAFWMDTEDPQLSTAISETDTTTALQNVDGSAIYGVELDVDWLLPLGPGALRGGLNASTIQGEFDDDTSLLVSVGGAGIVEFDLSDARVPRTRDIIFSFHSFYDFPLTPRIRASIGGSIQAESGGYENAIGDSPTRSDSGIPNTEFAGRDLDDFFLLDLRVSLDFGRWQLAGYGRNVTDEQYVLQNVLQNNFFNERERYGVEVSFRY